MSAWWFWQNYELCRKWREAHNDALMKVAYANSRCDASIYHNYVNPTANSSHGYSDTSYDKVSSEIQHNRCHEQESMACDEDGDGGNDSDSSELVFEIDENYLQFLEISMKHKQELKKKRMEEELEERKIPHQDKKKEKKSQISKSSFRDDRKYTPAPNCPQGKKRMEEMELLYGSAAQKIIGMETAIQLSFNKKCDSTNPSYWPVVPIYM